jgi:hypothetical protein
MTRSDSLLLQETIYLLSYVSTASLHFLVAPTEHYGLRSQSVALQRYYRAGEHARPDTEGLYALR